MNGHGSPNPENRQTYTVETGEYFPAYPENADGLAFIGWTPSSIPSGQTGAFTFTANWIEASPTTVRYTSESGLPDWSGTIIGELLATSYH